MSPRKILCPIDFSEGSRVAFRAAIDQARQAGAPLTLVHVVQFPVLVPEPALDPAYLNALMAAGEEQLAAWKREAEEAGVSEVRTENRPGAPWDQIVTVAVEGQHDLIVMGTHGRTGIRRVLIGSVAENVVRHAPCSVLVVR